MTKEDKELLLKDLCARLPYGVIINCDGKDEMLYTVAERGFLEVNDRFLIEDCKPYLRPMSSMTEEEMRVLDSMCYGVEMVSRLSGLKMFDEAFDWLNAHHFDYRGLIEKGLAIESPEDMYKNK